MENQLLAALRQFISREEWVTFLASSRYEAKKRIDLIIRVLETFMIPGYVQRSSQLASARDYD